MPRSSSLLMIFLAPWALVHCAGLIGADFGRDLADAAAPEDGAPDADADGAAADAPRGSLGDADPDAGALSCGNDQHACGGMCADNASVASCGTSCSPCSAPANGAPACNAGTCGFTCTGTYSACGDACCPESRRVTALSVGAGRQSCALTLGGVACWGDGFMGQLGNAENKGSTVPVDVSNLGAGTKAVSAGFDFVCALTGAAGVACWGSSMMGQLGNGTTTNTNTPVAVTALSGVTSLSVGWQHTCAVTSGVVKCWGSNLLSQLGTDTVLQGNSPITVAGVPSGVTSVASGQGHSCVLTSGGAIWCWGSNFYGQLGVNSKTLSTTPLSVVASGMRAVALGGHHSCAITTAGAAQCWGENMNGQAGDDSVEHRLVPVAVSGLASGVAEIALGDAHTCARTTAGAVLCWGSNDNGQLGNNSPADSHVPVPVVGLTSGAKEISAGFHHTCARTAAGVVCWGLGTTGELGNGTNVSSRVPVSVRGLL